MALLPVETTTLMSVATFATFVLLGGILIYLGRSTDPEKKIKLPWINLALGVVMSGAGFFLESTRLLQYLVEDTIILSAFLLIITGTVLTFISITILYTSRTTELSILRDREDHIKKIMKKLRDKYFARELEEDELKKMHADLVKEMAEIEVRLGEIKKK